MEKQIIGVCSYCELEFPDVKTAIVNTFKQQGGMKGPLAFSHGYCIRHYISVMKENGFSDEEIQQQLSSVKTTIPDLKTRTDLVKLWSQGIFTKEQLQQAQQTQQTENNIITERFKKLAGIRS